MSAPGSGLDRGGAHVARSFIPALPEHELAFLLGQAAPDERKALAAICETADLLDFEGGRVGVFTLL